VKNMEQDIIRRREAYPIKRQTMNIHRQKHELLHQLQQQLGFYPTDLKPLSKPALADFLKNIIETKHKKEARQ
jgi:hypothetical protein